MSVIQTTYDTKTKILKVTKDGAVIENVSVIWIDVFGDEAHIEVSTVVFDKDNDVQTRTTLRANEDGELVEKPDDEDLREDMAKLLYPRGA